MCISGNMNYKAEIKNTVWLIGLQGINYLLPLLVMPYLMVVLGAEQFGIYGFATTTAQLLMLLVDFGFNLTATKQVACAQGDREEINKIVGITMRAKLLLLLLSGIILAALLAIPRFAPYRIVSSIMFIMVIGQTFSFVWLFQGLDKIRLVSIVNTVCKLLILPLVFVLVKSEEDVKIAAFIQSGVYLMSGIVMIILTKYLNIVHYTTISWLEVWETLKESCPVFISTAVSSVYTLLYVLILGYFSDAMEVGRYHAAEKLMRVGCYLILLPLLQSFYPRISRFKQQEYQSAWRLIQKILWLISAIMLCYGIVLFFFSNAIIVFLGSDYSGADSVFKILAVVPLLMSLGGVWGQLGLLALGDKQEKIVFRNIYLVAAIVALISVMVVSKHLNAQWTAYCLLLTEAVVAIGMCIGFYKFKSQCQI